MDAQQQERAAFERSFAETAGIELPATTAASADAVAVAEPEAAAVEPAAPASVEPLESADAAPAGQQAEQVASDDDDPVVFDGFKRSELRRLLLGNAAEVESLKRQVDKAHGNIGELKRSFQQSKDAPASAPVQQAPELPPELKQFEEDYPEVAKYVRSVVVTPKPERNEAAQATAADPVDQGQQQPQDAGIDPVAVELAVMDRMHQGWRDKVGSQEFGMWLASRDEQTRSDFLGAQTVDALAGVIGQYDQWAASRSAAADKAAKGQQRLQKATTPSGNAPRPQAAPTEREAMEAAFKRTLGL